jgi:NAD(P)-dependent dehydrogenase (short-subunit alcohol dehydrogenase family)
MSMPGRIFEGQRISVIGGTSGIGAAMARQAAEAGADVIVAGRRQLDIGAETSIRDYFAALGPIDHLVVTAAFVRPGPFRTGAVDDARASMEGKFWSQYLCARHAQVNRSILLFSGVFSRRPAKGMSILAAVNGAVEGLGRALAVELAPVRVNVVSPGLVQGTSAYDGMPAAARDAMYANAAAGLPAGIVGDADSVAGPALGLLASPYATGSVLDIDGGALLA